MTGTILCGTDLGPSGARALDVAAMLARALDASVCVVHAAAVPHVDPNVDPATRPAADMLAARAFAHHDEAVRALELEQQRLVSAGVRVASARVVEGRPAEVVSREAESASAELAVVGAHARSHTIRDRFLGSTADHVIRHACCPVIVATGDERLVELSGREIVVGVDQGAPSLAALRAALALAGRAGARVHAVGAGSDAPAIDAAHAAARAVEREQGAATTAMTWSSGPGAPADVILDAASVRGAALVALGTHARAALARAVLGSTAEDVARRATVPVLLCRAS